MSAFVWYYNSNKNQNPKYKKTLLERFLSKIKPAKKTKAPQKNVKSKKQKKEKVKEKQKKVQPQLNINELPNFNITKNAEQNKKKKKKPNKIWIVIILLFIGLIALRTYNQNRYNKTNHQDKNIQEQNLVHEKEFKTEEKNTTEVIKESKNETENNNNVDFQENSSLNNKNNTKQIVQENENNRKSLKAKNFDNDLLFQKKCALVQSKNNFAIGFNKNLYINDSIFHIGDMVDLPNLSPNPVKIDSYFYKTPKIITLRLKTINNKVCNIDIDSLKNFDYKIFFYAIKLTNKKTHNSIVYSPNQNIFFNTVFKTTIDDKIATFSTPVGDFNLSANKE